MVLQDSKITDTSAADARRGKDIQGIPWERLSISREKYRQTRVEQYKNYENVPQSGEGSEKVMLVHLLLVCVLQTICVVGPSVTQSFFLF